jgi:hypothetical protein
MSNWKFRAYNTDNRPNVKINCRIHGHLLLFFTKRIIHYEFIPSKQSTKILSSVCVTFTAGFSSKTTGWTSEFCVTKIRLPPQCFQLSDFSPRSQALAMKKQSYSLHLAKWDFSLFPKLKLSLKVSHFESFDIHYKVKRVMKGLS